MSHFTVLVIGPNFEEQLQPFHEYECTGILDQYVRFIDHTDEVTAEYNDPENTRTMIKLPNGELKNTYDSMFYRPATEEELKKIGTPIGSGIAQGIRYSTEYKGRERHVMVEDHTGLEKVEIPYSEIYESVEAFAKDWHGYDVHAETGRIGRMTNPNAKWDWYVVGGRWTGFFRVKNGADSAELGKPGLMTEPAEVGTADQLRKGDVDWQAMRDHAAAKANDEYDEFERVTAGLEIPPTWKEHQDAHEDIDDARSEYASHPWVKALRAARLDPWFSCTHDYFCVKKGQGGRGQFIARAVNRVGVPYAVVKDSQWFSKGEMGWWGVSSGDIDQDEWNQKFREMIDDLPDDTLLTLVDCHI